jgi:hypothetical protein
VEENPMAGRLFVKLTFGVALLTAAAAPPSRGNFPQGCDYNAVFDAMMIGRSQPCEFSGVVVARRIDDTLMYVALSNRDAQARGLTALRLSIVPSAAPPAWRWASTTARARVDQGVLFIDPGAGSLTPMAFGRFADDLAERYPKAYRFGFRQMQSVYWPDISVDMFARAQPSTRCKHDRGAYYCFEASGKAFFIR